LAPSDTRRPALGRENRLANRARFTYAVEVIQRSRADSTERYRHLDEMVMTFSGMQ